MKHFTNRELVLFFNLYSLAFAQSRRSVEVERTKVGDEGMGWKIVHTNYKSISFIAQHNETFSDCIMFWSIIGLRYFLYIMTQVDH